jgi:hypothetical protein
MDDLLDALARLNARLESMERRVCALERSTSVSLPLVQAATLPSRKSGAEKFELPQAPGVFPVLGRAMLGIAGAYVLRAVAESGAFPKLAIVVLALAYAGAWLVWASRVPAADRLARTVYAATAALILAPMLGELRLRFQVLPDSVTSVLLITFVLAAWALAWRRNLTSITWVAGVTGVSTALVLLIASRDFTPYIAALLLLALVSEGAAAGGRWFSLRFLLAPAIDLATWILIYIYSLPATSRPEYGSPETAVLLTLPSLTFLIYGASIAFRTIVLRQRIARFEISQASMTFLLAAYGWFAFAPARLAWFGALCWILCVACYAAATLSFDCLPDQRNHYVYASWGLALLLVGSFLILPSSVMPIFLKLASILAMMAGVQVARVMLGFHSLIYLLAAAFVSGLLQYIGQALAGVCPGAPGSRLWIVALSVFACCIIAGRLGRQALQQRLLRLLHAILAVGVAAAFLVSAFVRLAAIGMSPQGSYVAVVRTFVTCALALGLACAGARWQRTELVWTAYGVLAFVTVKLLLEDLRLGHPGSAAISIFLYAVALIVVPRVAAPEPVPTWRRREAPRRSASTGLAFLLGCA